MNNMKRFDAIVESTCGPRLRAEGAAIGKAQGKAEGGRNAVLAVLRARFKKVPKGVENAIRAISDSIALESWAAHAATCQSMEEFAEALK